MLRSILFIDDDEVTRMIIRSILERLNASATILEAGNGREGLQVLQQAAQHEIPRLILLDLNMPVMDGWAFLDAFSKIQTQQFPYTRIAVLTSSTDPRDHARAYSYPIVAGYYSKPITILSMGNILDDLAKTA